MINTGLEIYSISVGDCLLIIVIIGMLSGIIINSRRK